MMSEIQKLLDDYQAWLKDKTVLRQVNDWIEITTPYLDRHNDYLQIYAKKEKGSFLLTDDGYVIGDLRSSGGKLEGKRRQDLLKMTLNGFGVQQHGDALEVRASPANFALRKHNLIQAMLAVNDLFYLAAPMVASIFLEDVAQWLDLNEIRYTPNVKFTGKSGYDNVFDFVIPKSRLQPERIIKTMGHPNKDTAQAAILAWVDTREVRSSDSRAYAFLNDTDQTPTTSVADALRSYEVCPVLWSARETVKAELVA
jgi:hypothetical protein